MGHLIVRFFQTGFFPIGNGAVNLVVIVIVAYVEVLMVPALYGSRYGPVKLVVDDEAARLVYRNGREKIFRWSNRRFHLDLYDIRHLTTWIEQMKPICLSWMDQGWADVSLPPEALDFLVDSAKSHGLSVAISHPSLIRRFSTKFTLPNADVYQLRAKPFAKPLP
ncbi:MAG: hypothetical protein WA688_04275 [Thermoplasmata archaeon]